MSFKKDVNPRSQSKMVDDLSAEFCELMTVCRQNFYHAQKLQKQVYENNVKPKSYPPGEKVWLNSKYLKTKQNRKLEVKSFRLFRLLHLMGKQAYKCELPKRWRIHNVFLVLLLEQNTTKKRRVDENVIELDAGGNKKE